LTSRQRYFAFIHDKLKLEDDPFAVAVPLERMPVVFVECPQLEEMKQPGSCIFLAKRGMGKTSMYMMLEHYLRKPEDPFGKPENLVVGINLPRIGAALRSRPELARGEVSYLSPDILTQRLFNAYWEEIHHSPWKAEAREKLVSNKAKWATLLWFYRQYPPDHLSVDDDPQLASWLMSQDVPPELFSTRYNPILPLEEVLKLITDSEVGAYERVYILVDGTETLSPRALERLLEDAQALHDMHLPGLELKLFLEDTWKELVEAIMDAVRTGEIEIVEFAEEKEGERGKERKGRWTEEHLRVLLRRRVYAVTPKEDLHYSPLLEEYCLDKLLCDFSPYADPVKTPIESRIVRARRDARAMPFGWRGLC